MMLHMATYKVALCDVCASALQIWDMRSQRASAAITLVNGRRNDALNAVVLAYCPSSPPPTALDASGSDSGVGGVGSSCFGQGGGGGGGLVCFAGGAGESICAWDLRGGVCIAFG